MFLKVLVLIYVHHKKKETVRMLAFKKLKCLFVLWFEWTYESTIFQTCQDGATVNCFVELYEPLLWEVNMS